MSLASAIRAAIGGRSMKSRIEEEDPEKVEEDPDKEAEGEEEKKPDAEDEETDKEAEGDEEKDPDAEDDEEEKEMSAKDRKTFARGRRAERRRIAAILGSNSAEASPKLAAHLAFGTEMRSKQALATLKASDAPAAGSSLAARMAAQRQPKLGGGGGSPDKRAATVAGVKAAVLAIHPRK
jgi:hypothetical protein